MIICTGEICKNLELASSRWSSLSRDRSTAEYVCLSQALQISIIFALFITREPQVHTNLGISENKE